MDQISKHRQRLSWAKAVAKDYQEHFVDVASYCMFMGYPYSGHSVCGALLNAHPSAVISHELDALAYVELGVTREELYSLILRRDRWFSMRNNRWCDYGYTVPGQWQGRFQQLSVIGDKKGGRSSLRLNESPELLSRLERLTQAPIKIVHVVRNPFDNVARIALRRQQTLDEAIREYLRMIDINAELIARTECAEIITVRHEALIEKPTEELDKLLRFVGLTACGSYLEDCTSIVFCAPSRSRELLSWDDFQVGRVQSKIDEVAFLRGYTFED